MQPISNPSGLKGTGTFSLFAVCFFLIIGSARAAHTQASLIFANEIARPGETVLAAIHLRMEPGWHTYWKNPGASGTATEINWQLPKGVQAGEIQWPLPEKLPDTNATTYIYERDVLLLVPIKLAPDLAPGPLELKAKVSWLECEMKCIPAKADLRGTLTVGSETKSSTDASEIAEWQNKVPKNAAPLSPSARWEKPATGDLRPLLIEWSSPNALSQPDFYPYANETFEVQAETERIPSEPGKILLRAQVKKFQGDWPKQISGVLVQQSGTERTGHEADLSLGSTGSPGATAASAGLDSGVAAPSLLRMLIYAFIGGLILNVMPCVLPVIALKILGFVRQGTDHPGRVRFLGIVYSVGVLVSFLVLAGLVIGVKAAGHRAGWGMQFSSPQFLVVLTILVTLVALNLFGLFDVNLSSEVMGAAGSLASRHGAAGAFFNGVLATILATPCTAPFLGAALGFAFAQNAPVIVLMFLTVGLGLALPYLVLSWQPAWLKFLPKPGAWMEKFKIAMGFPMLATTIWLFSLLPVHYGERSSWLALFLVVLAMAVWVFGEFVQRGRSRRGLGLSIALLLLLIGYVAILETKLKWRSSQTVENPKPTLGHAPAGIAWQPWSPAAVAAARAEGRPVLIDFTAGWCLTCNTIVKPALENAAVRKKIEEVKAQPLLADYTLYPENIGNELDRLGRAGVPVVVIYPKDSSKPPVVYDVVTSGTLLNALAAAATQ